jgi:hypothetical protein
VIGRSNWHKTFGYLLSGASGKLFTAFWPLGR